MKLTCDFGHMHDTWFGNVNGQVHAFHLKLSPAQDALDTVGHAVSSDLLHWTRLPDTLPPLRGENERDYHEKFTGCFMIRPAALNGGQQEDYLLYYTMRDKRAGNQRIGVAISQDMVHFVPWEGNPVYEPDPALCVGYANIGDLPWNIVDCRDPLVVFDEAAGVYVMYVAAAVLSGEEGIRGGILAVESCDLLHWSKPTVAYRMKQSGMVEVPDVFFLDGKWVMTLLTGTQYRGRGGILDPYIQNFTVYAVADNPRGPFTEPETDNVQIGGTRDSGASCRSVLWKGRRILFYTDRNPDGNTLSLPKELHAAGGILRAFYMPELRSLRVKSLLGGGAYPPAELLHTSFAWQSFGGVCDSAEDGYRMRTGPQDYQTVLLEARAASLEMEAAIDVQGKAAGFAFRLFAANGGMRDFVLSAEPLKKRLVLLDNLAFTLVMGREQVFPARRPFFLRLLILEGTIEAYIDDVLVLQGALPAFTAVQAGLFCEGGEAVFHGLAAYALEK